MRHIAQWKRWFADNSDLITPVRTTADIRRAKAEGRTGIILGFQNTSALEDQIGYVSLFEELGVGVMQLTYNTQNLAGAGCYEPRDTGLSEVFDRQESSVPICEKRSSKHSIRSNL